jgi:hypothetical protein
MLQLDDSHRSWTGYINPRMWTYVRGCANNAQIRCRDKPHSVVGSTPLGASRDHETSLPASARFESIPHRKMAAHLGRSPYSISSKPYFIRCERRLGQDCRARVGGSDWQRIRDSLPPALRRDLSVGRTFSSGMSFLTHIALSSRDTA